ncbi:unnamed protein product, partial [marine sediment metagenome]
GNIGDGKTTSPKDDPHYHGTKSEALAEKAGTIIIP